jgi:hypothetical protein
MPTQSYHNRQGDTPIALPADGSVVDVLATGGATPEDYQEGMSVNGGSSLNLSVENLSNTPGNIVTLVGYRRVTRTGQWTQFWTDTVAVSTNESFKIQGINGFANVRVTAAGAGAGAQAIVVSATISSL